MKLGLISDVHGDLGALEAAWSHLAALGADQVICAGDIVGYGRHPDQVAAFLAERKVPCVRGNHDRWALAGPAGTPDEFGGGIPGPAAREFLSTLKPDLVLVLDSRFAVIVHGSPYSDMQYVTPRTYPPATLRYHLQILRADLLVVGHTHIPMWYRCEEGLVVNPGSLISEPVVRSSRSFAVVDVEPLTATFYDVRSGKVLDVAAWTEESAPDPATE